MQHPGNGSHGELKLNSCQKRIITLLRRQPMSLDELASLLPRYPKSNLLVLLTVWDNLFTHVNGHWRYLETAGS